jgi:hypothetical protein
MTQCTRTAAAALALSVGSCLAQAAEPLLPPTPQIEEAVRKIWFGAAARQPLCAGPSVLYPDQQGIQELQPSFAPGQWVLRLARLPQRKAEIERLDHLARFGLLERRDSFINLGPIQALPALEYRPTPKGWVRNMTESGYFPCFYYGMSQVKVVGYTESAKDAEGVSRVSIQILVVADNLEDWAKGQEAAALFPGLRQQFEGRKGTYNFNRAADGKLRTSARHEKPIDDRGPPRPEAALPGMDAAADGIRRSLEAAKPGTAPPAACLQLLSVHMLKLWKVGDAGAATQAILQFPAVGSRDIAALTHTRLRRLEQAGLLKLQGDGSAGQVVAVPAPGIGELLARHGNCLPLGRVRVVVDGVLRDRLPGERQKFKARYVVEEPAEWIRKLAHPEMLADLQAILKLGQPFEGTTLKMPDGWLAAYPIDRRPLPAQPSLSAVGIPPEWASTTEAGLPGASVANHEVYILVARAPAVPPPPGGPRHVRNRVDVLVHARPRPLLILVNSYEPFDWHFKVHSGARVDAVLAVGYYEQRIAGIPPATPLVSAFYSAEGSPVRPDPARTYLGLMGYERIAGKLGVTPTGVLDTDSGRMTIGAAR